MKVFRIVISVLSLFISSSAFAFGGGHSPMFKEDWMKGTDSVGVYFGGKGPVDVRFVTCKGQNETLDTYGTCVCKSGFKPENNICVKDACYGFSTTGCRTACKSSGGVPTYTICRGTGTCINNSCSYSVEIPCPTECPDCQKCDTSIGSCIPDTGEDGQDTLSCKTADVPNGTCSNGICVPVTMQCTTQCGVCQQCDTTNGTCITNAAKSGKTCTISTGTGTCLNGKCAVCDTSKQVTQCPTEGSCQSCSDEVGSYTLFTGCRNNLYYNFANKSCDAICSSVTNYDEGCYTCIENGTQNPTIQFNNGTPCAQDKTCQGGKCGWVDCTDPHATRNNSNVCTCNQGYYGDGNTCTVCPANASCPGGTSFTCTGNYEKVENQCLAPCDTAHGEIRSGTTCVCDTANKWYGNAGSCVHCTGNGVIYDGVGACKCDSGYYQDGDICTACPQHGVCSETAWTGCEAGYKKENDICATDACYNVQLTGCQTSCSSSGGQASYIECNGTGTCNDGTCGYTQECTPSCGACEKCNNGTCEEDTNKTNTSCATNKICNVGACVCDTTKGFVDDEENGCTCAEDKYISNSSCVDCPQNALCNGLVFSCTNGYESNGTACICPEQKYINNEDICTTCPANATCNGTTFTCNEHYLKEEDACVIDACVQLAIDYPDCLDTCTSSGGQATATYKETCGENNTWACNTDTHVCEDPCAGQTPTGCVKTLKAQAGSCVPDQYYTADEFHRCDIYKVCNDDHECVCVGYMKDSECTTCPDNATCDGTTFTCPENWKKETDSCVDPCTIGEHANFVPTTCFPDHHAQNGECVPDYASPGSHIGCNPGYDSYACNGEGVCTCLNALFRTSGGECAACNSTSSEKVDTVADCNACNGTDPRTLIEYDENKYCIPTTCPTDQLYFRALDGSCILCSTTTANSSTDEYCSACDNTNSPRFMGTDGKCYSCSETDSITTTRGACLKCSNRTYNADTGKCELCDGECTTTCSVDNYTNCHKAECTALGDGFTYSEEDGCQPVSIPECSAQNYTNCDQEGCEGLGTGFTYSEENGCQPVSIPECDPEKEVLDDDNSCICNTENYWYPDVEDNCIHCVGDGVTYNSQTKKCVCNNGGKWFGDPETGCFQCTSSDKYVNEGDCLDCPEYTICDNGEIVGCDTWYEFDSEHSCVKACDADNLDKCSPDDCAEAGGHIYLYRIIETLEDPLGNPNDIIDEKQVCGPSNSEDYTCDEGYTLDAQNFFCDKTVTVECDANHLWACREQEACENLGIWCLSSVPHCTENEQQCCEDKLGTWTGTSCNECRFVCKHVTIGDDDKVIGYQASTCMNDSQACENSCQADYQWDENNEWCYKQETQCVLGALSNCHNNEDCTQLNQFLRYDDGEQTCVCDDSQDYYGNIESCKYCNSDTSYWDDEDQTCVCDNFKNFYGNTGNCQYCDPVQNYLEEETCKSRNTCQTSDDCPYDDQECQQGYCHTLECDNNVIPGNVTPVCFNGYTAEDHQCTPNFFSDVKCSDEGTCTEGGICNVSGNICSSSHPESCGIANCEVAGNYVCNFVTIYVDQQNNEFRKTTSTCVRDENACQNSCGNDYIFKQDDEEFNPYCVRRIENNSSTYLCDVEHIVEVCEDATACQNAGGYWCSIDNACRETRQNCSNFVTCDYEEFPGSLPHEGNMWNASYNPDAAQCHNCDDAKSWEVIDGEEDCTNRCNNREVISVTEQDQTYYYCALKDLTCGSNYFKTSTGDCKPCNDSYAWAADNCGQCSNRTHSNGICHLTTCPSNTYRAQGGHCIPCSDTQIVLPVDNDSDCTVCQNRKIDNGKCAVKEDYCQQRDGMIFDQDKGCVSCTAEQSFYAEATQCAKCGNRYSETTPTGNICVLGPECDDNSDCADNEFCAENNNLSNVKNCRPLNETRLTVSDIPSYLVNNGTVCKKSDSCEGFDDCAQNTSVNSKGYCPYEYIELNIAFGKEELSFNNASSYCQALNGEIFQVDKDNKTRLGCHYQTNPRVPQTDSDINEKCYSDKTDNSYSPLMNQLNNNGALPPLWLSEVSDGNALYIITATGKRWQTTTSSETLLYPLCDLSSSGQ